MLARLVDEIDGGPGQKDIEDKVIRRPGEVADSLLGELDVPEEMLAEGLAREPLMQRLVVKLRDLPVAVVVEFFQQEARPLAEAAHLAVAQAEPLRDVQPDFSLLRIEGITRVVQFPTV